MRRTWITDFALTTSLLFAFSCARSSLPAFWQEACAAETGRFISERPVASGLAMVDDIGIGEADLILESGAEFLEYSHLQTSNVSFPDDAVYAKGSGLYAVRLTRNAEPECARLLALWGYDPLTLARVAEPERGVRLNGLLLDAACLSAERSGELAQPRFRFAPGAQDAYLSQFSAPYRIQTMVEKHPKAIEGEQDVYREVAQIVESESGRVIAEEINLRYNTGDYFRPAIVCGPADGRPGGRWRLRVFREDQT